MQRLVVDNLEHLRRWLPWALHEPEGAEKKLDRIRAGRREFESGTDLRYGVFERESGRMLGACGLHDRGEEPGVREIGYWIDVGFVNRGLATELSAALTRMGFECEAASRIEIHCDPRNAASAAVPRKLGYRLRETRPNHRPGVDGELRTGLIWEILPDELAHSAAGRVAVHYGFDPLGTER